MDKIGKGLFIHSLTQNILTLGLRKPNFLCFGSRTGILFIYISIYVYIYTGLPTKDETSGTILGNLFGPFY